MYSEEKETYSQAKTYGDRVQNDGYFKEGHFGPGSDRREPSGGLKCSVFILVMTTQIYTQVKIYCSAYLISVHLLYVNYTSIFFN